MQDVHTQDVKGPTNDTPPVEIKVRDNGPYKVTGPVRLIDPNGGVFEIEAGESIVLCRCGLSNDKPFCDRAHKGQFESCVRADS